MKKATIFVPFERIDPYGDVFSKDCKFTFTPGIKILQSHKDNAGLTIVTECEIDELSIIYPRLYPRYLQ